MKLNTASRTAQYMALFRAIESNRPANDRLFYDPFAILFLDSSLKFITKLSGISLFRNFIPKIIHNQGNGAISSGIARTKYIDDLLEKTMKEGVKQVIILGAGFDTRGFRLPSLKEISVIEIDHPDTSRFKIERLKSSHIELPSNISFYEINFEKQSLEEIFETHKISFDLPTTIIWEGVTNYLTEDSIKNTFEFTKRFTDKFNIIFTYINRLVLEHPEEFKGTQKVMKTLKEHEESWTFGFYPEKLTEYLKQFNLTLIEDLNASEYRKKYMPERVDIAEGYEFYRVVLAKR